jgi:hypothetical protein
MIPAPLAAALPLAEILLLCPAVFAACRRREMPISEAGAYAAVLPLMALSAIVQFALLWRTAWLAPAAEALLCAAALAAAWRWRCGLARDLAAMVAAAGRQPGMLCAAAGLLWGYLLLQALLLPPDSAQWPALAKALLLLQEGSGSAAGVLMTQGPINGLAPAAVFLRHGGDWGIGILGLLAHTGIVLAGYAGARRYAWPPTALTVALVLLGLPRLVLLAATPDPEILAAAAGALSLLALFRCMETPSAGELLLVALAIPFASADTTLGPAFPLVLAALGAALLTQRHGAAFLWRLLARRRVLAAAALVPLALFTQVWRPTLGRPHFDPNPDGLQGALVNSAHYLALGVDLPPAVNDLTEELLGRPLSGLMEGLGNAIALLLGFDPEGRGRFAVLWQTAPATCGFGPLALLLVAPAVLNSLLRGTRRLKSVALALSGYFALVCLVPAWRPENVGYLSVIFACSAPCLAYWLPPWRLSLRLKHGLQIAAALMGLYAAWGNSARPLLDPSPLAAAVLGRVPPGGAWATAWAAAWHESVWHQSRWGRDRFEPARRAMGERCVATLLAGAPPGGPLIFISPRPELAYPFVTGRPGSHLLPPGQSAGHGWVVRSQVCGEIAILVARSLSNAPPLPPAEPSHPEA